MWHWRRWIGAVTVDVGWAVCPAIVKARRFGCPHRGRFGRRRGAAAVSCRRGRLQVPALRENLGAISSCLDIAPLDV